jgi:hypothetical protein
VNLLSHGPQPSSNVIHEGHVGFAALKAVINEIWHMSPSSLVNQYAFTELCNITPQKAAVLTLQQIIIHFDRIKRTNTLTQVANRKEYVHGGSFFF